MRHSLRRWHPSKGCHRALRRVDHATNRPIPLKWQHQMDAWAKLLTAAATKCNVFYKIVTFLLASLFILLINIPKIKITDKIHVIKWKFHDIMHHQSLASLKEANTDAAFLCRTAMQRRCFSQSVSLLSPVFTVGWGSKDTGGHNSRGLKPAPYSAKTWHCMRTAVKEAQTNERQKRRRMPTTSWMEPRASKKLSKRWIKWRNLHQERTVFEQYPYEQRTEGWRRSLWKWCISRLRSQERILK